MGRGLDGWMGGGMGGWMGRGMDGWMGGGMGWEEVEQKRTMNMKNMEYQEREVQLQLACFLKSSQDRAGEFTVPSTEFSSLPM
jgi:hypothetical protein